MDTPATHDEANEAPRRPAWRRWLRRILYGVGGLVGTILVLLLLLIALLQTPWGSNAAAGLLARLVNPFEDATIQIGSAEGNWIQTLELHDVSLLHTTDGDSVRVAHLDTLELRYALPALFHKTLHLRTVRIAHPTLSARQRTDSTWALPHLAPTGPDTTQTTFTIRLDRLTLHQGAITTQFYAPGRDSTVHIRNLQLNLRDAVVGPPALQAYLDTLGLKATLPGATPPMQLQAQASLAERRFTLDRLALDAPHSRVRGHGTLRLPTGSEETFDDVDFTLTATPLAFRDVAPLVPMLGLNPEERLQLEARVTGSGRLLHAATEASFSDGGRITLDVTATPTTQASAADSLHYQAQGKIRRLSMDVLTAPALAATRINADLQTNLAGPALNNLSGTLTARLFDTHLMDYRIGRADLDARFRQGRATLDLQGQFEGAALAIQGTTRPFDASPTYDLTTRVANLNVGAFLTEATAQSNLTGTGHIKGAGVAPPSADLTADLTVEPSSFNYQPIDEGHLHVRLVNDSLAFDTRLAFPDGRLAAAGHASLTTPMRYAIEKGRLDDVDVAALAGDTTRSALSGTFRAQGRGTDPATTVLSTNLTLHDSFYGPYRLRAGVTRLQLKQGLIDATARANLVGGQLNLTATARPFAEPLTYQISNGSFQEVDIGAFLQDSTQSSHLNGTFSLKGRGFEPATMQTTTQIALDTSRINQQRIEAAQLQATLRSKQLAFDMQWNTPAGGARLAGTARPFDEVLSYAIREGRLQNVNLGTLANVPALQTTLNGHLSLNGQGFDPTTMTLDAQLDLARSKLNQAVLNEGALTAQLNAGTAQFDGQLAFEQGTATVHATGRDLGATPTYQATAQLSNVNVATLAGIDSLDTSLSLDATLDGTGLTPQTLSLTSRITAQPSHYGQVRLDTLDINARMTSGLLQVDTLIASSNIARARGGGQIALFDSTEQHTSDFTLEAALTSLRPLQSALDARTLDAGTGHFTGRLYGQPGTLRFDLTATLSTLIYNDIRLADFEMHVAGGRGDTTLFSALEVQGELGLLSVPTIAVENVRYNARYDGDMINFDTRLHLDEERNARLAGVVDLRPERQQLTLQTLNLRLGPDQWSLLQEASITYRKSLYRVSNLLLYSDQQQIAADGIINFEGRQSFIVTIENVRMNPIADLIGFAGLGGRLSGTLDMNGLARAPNMNGTLNLDIASNDQAVGQLRLRLAYDSLRTHVDALLTHVDGSTLTVQGSLPVDLRLSTPSTDSVDTATHPVDLTGTAQSFSIGWIDPFLDPELAEDAQGQLTAEVHIGGTWNTPDMDGQATLRDGSVRLPLYGVTYDRIDADLTTRDNQVIVQQMVARSGGGRLQAEGTVDLTELTLGTFDLSLNPNDFLAVDTRAYRAKIDGDLTLQGTTQQPALRGNIEVLSGDFYLGAVSTESDLAQVQLTEQDQQTLERRFGLRLSQADTTTFDFYEALDMSLTVELERDTWLRSRSTPEMNVQFTGDLDVSKAPYAEEEIFGTINVVPERSRIVQFGRAFDITKGTLTFNGPPTEPVMDLVATYEPRTRSTTESEVQITLSVSGRPDQLDLTLNSNPPMPTSDMFCYIALARPCGQFTGGGGGGNGFSGEELAGQVAFGQATNIIENLAASKLGLDVVRIENRPTGTYITAGQYISPRFFAAIEQVISTQTEQQNIGTTVPNVTLEYELTSWLLIRAMYRNPDFRLNLFWEYGY